MRFSEKGGPVTAFNHLFQPIMIGGMNVKNRLLMSAMSINFGVDKNGNITEQLIQYMVSRAKGGVGMMLVGGGGVDPIGAELPDLPALWQDSCVPGLRNLVEAVKPYDCRVGMQIMHGGRQSYHDDKVAPSAIKAPALVKTAPRAMELDEIAAAVAAFGDAALRCKEAGLDFIEIHGAHGYLINQFLSPNANCRTDRYGGSFDNRIRFLMEVLQDIKHKCGHEYPVGIRINGQDYIDGGWTLDDALELSPLLEAQGADYLHISAGVYGSRQLTIPSMYVEQGCFAHLAEAVKTRVSLPVVAVGRIKSAHMAEDLVGKGKADIVALGRSLLADPQWPEKTYTGGLDRIRPCIGCCLGCINAVFDLEPGGCVVNPDVGREYLLLNESGENKESRENKNKKKCLVVGAGPAGLAAARMAAIMGHKVVVCEKQARAGGALKLASKAPGRSELGDILDYFINEIKRLQILIHYDSPLDERMLESVLPDVVILSTGSLVDMPILKGIYQVEMDLCTVTEVLAGKVDPGGKVIIWGGNQAGLTLADHLASQGKQVTVLHRKKHFAADMSRNDRFYLRERLKKNQVSLFKEVKIKKFFKNGVEFYSQGQEIKLNGFDGLILADAFVSLRQDANMVRKRGIEFHFIGDAKQPRHLMYAISEAEELGRNLS
ncbi:MAG: FAD-dependent oxidoreductase [Desulfobacteraceae bacterium]|nr:FAD-dependent oxidoreductase [Desulfobacteraceae bacterium]